MTRLDLSSTYGQVGSMAEPETKARVAELLGFAPTYGIEEVQRVGKEVLIDALLTALSENPEAMAAAEALVAQFARARAQPPTLLQKAANFGVALTQEAAAIATGVAPVSEEEGNRRFAICQTCLPPDGYYDEGRCMHPKCGCYLRVKTAWRAQACPIARW